jgi:hypothetical protein
MWTIEDLATDKINLSATFYCSFKKLQNPLEILDPETAYAVDYGYRRILQTMPWRKKNFCCFRQFFHNDNVNTYCL